MPDGFTPNIMQRQKFNALVPVTTMAGGVQQKQQQMKLGNVRGLASKQQQIQTRGRQLEEKESRQQQIEVLNEFKEKKAYADQKIRDMLNRTMKQSWDTINNMKGKLASINVDVKRNIEDYLASEGDQALINAIGGVASGALGVLQTPEIQDLLKQQALDNLTNKLISDVQFSTAGTYLKPYMEMPFESEGISSAVEKAIPIDRLFSSGALNPLAQSSYLMEAATMSQPDLTSFFNVLGIRK